MPATNNAVARRLIGESAREIGILVLVFGPLDAAIKNDSTSAAFTIVTAVMGLTFLAAGIHIESSTARNTP